jgi:hypothetical protein
MKDETNAALLRALTGSRKDPGTHMHVIGASGSGKTKFLESLIRDLTYSEHGFAVFDWHGKLYDDVLNYLAYHWTEREIYLLDPAGGQFITPYNPFVRPTQNVSGMAQRFVDAITKTWGASNTNATPRLARVASTLFQFAIAAEETLPNAELLLRFNHREVLRHAKQILSEPRFQAVRETLEEMEDKQTPKAWDDFVQSANNRLARFLNDELMRRFLAYKEGNLDIRAIMDRDAILLVNLSRTDAMPDPEPARVFGSLLLADFFHAALLRPDTEQRFVLFLDEFQEYITADSPKILDQVRKGGLDLVLAHQRLGQLHFEGDTEMRDSVLANARIKVAFSLDDFTTASFMARQILIEEINRDVVKDELRGMQTIGHELSWVEVKRHSTTTLETDSASLQLYQDEATRSSTEGASRARGESVSVGSVPIQRAILEERVTSRQYYSLTEKESRQAERLMRLPERTCIIRVKHDSPVEHKVREIRSYHYDENTRKEYEQKRFEFSGAVTPSDADAELKKSRDAFLDKVKKKPRPSADAGPKNV